MKKSISVLLLSLVILSSCTIEIDTRDEGNDEDNNEDAAMTESELALRLEEVLLIDYGLYSKTRELEFDLYLERPDLMMEQPATEDLYTSDLPLELQPQLMYVSELDDTIMDSGRMCNRPLFPHRCAMTLDADSETKEETYLVKVLFEDNTYATSQITVPIPKPMESPAIKFPLETPSKEGTFEMKFEDVGADQYDISVYLCREYQNDGINPCLDGAEYTLGLVEDEWKVLFDNSLYPLYVKVRDGLIVVSSNMPLIYEESVEYNVKASKSVNTGEVPFYIESADSITF